MSCAPEGGEPDAPRTWPGNVRRDFFRTSWLASMGLSLAGFTGAILGFLWPTVRGGFGAKINVDQLTAFVYGLVVGLV